MTIKHEVLIGNDWYTVAPLVSPFEGDNDNFYFQDPRPQPFPPTPSVMQSDAQLVHGVMRVLKRSPNYRCTEEFECYMHKDCLNFISVNEYENDNTVNSGQWHSVTVSKVIAND